MRNHLIAAGMAMMLALMAFSFPGGHAAPSGGNAGCGEQGLVCVEFEGAITFNDGSLGCGYVPEWPKLCWMGKNKASGWATLPVLAGTTHAGVHNADEWCDWEGLSQVEESQAQGVGLPTPGCAETAIDFFVASPQPGCATIEGDALVIDEDSVILDRAIPESVVLDCVSPF